MTFLRLLNVQGIAGLAASSLLALLLILAKVDAHRLRSQAATFERLYRGEVSAHATEVAAVRAAAEEARAADRANAARVATAQKSINERTAYDLETRLADARVRAQRLRALPGPATAARAGGNAPLPGLSPAAGGIDEGAGEDRLPDADALIATEQAIQLDELIKWVRAQSGIQSNPR